MALGSDCLPLSAASSASRSYSSAKSVIRTLVFSSDAVPGESSRPADGQKRRMKASASWGPLQTRVTFAPGAYSTIAQRVGGMWLICARQPLADIEFCDGEEVAALERHRAEQCGIRA